MCAAQASDERAVDAEVLVGDHSLPLGDQLHPLEELARHALVEQALAVVAEAGVIPDAIVDCQSDEPAEQQVEVDLLDELALRAHRVEDLDQQRPQQKLRRYRRSPTLGVHRRKVRVHRRQHRVDQDAQLAQRDDRAGHAPPDSRS